MTGEVVKRVHEWLPADLTDPAEIEQAIDGTGWEQEWDRSVLDQVVRGVDRRRETEVPEAIRGKRERIDVMGPQDARTKEVRASDGTVLGEPENVRTWVDTHGNVMGHNTETGTRKKVTDAEDR